MNRFEHLLYVSRWIRRLVALPVLAGAFIGAGQAHADWRENFQIHGFAAQGYVNTSENSFYGDSESGSFNFTELGLNLSYRPHPSLLLSGQLLSRTAGEMYDGSPEVDFALLDWTASSGAQSTWGVMLGRIKNPLGLYNETRDVAFTRPAIFLPQQIYYDRVRNLLLASDGARLYAQRFNDFGAWDVTLGIGKGVMDENVEVAFLGQDFAGELDHDGLAFVGRLGYESSDGAWRLALSGARIDLGYQAQAGDPIGSGDIEVGFWIASLQYNSERWSLTAEYMEEPLDYDNFETPLDGRDGRGQGYYLQGTYLLHDDVELLLRYGEGFADKDDRDGRDLAAALAGGLVPAHRFFHKDWTVGLRWDVTPSFMLRAEYQWTSGTWSLSQRENPVPNNTKKNWEMFSLLGAYRF